MTERLEPEAAARALINERFPECSAAFVTSSVLRGEGTATSDLDIVVVTDRAEAPFRASFKEHGWPIEVFVHTAASLREYFLSDAKRYRPSLPAMCADGLVLRDRHGMAGEIKAEGRAVLDAGPAPLTVDQLATRRYALTDILDDFRGTENRGEGVFIALALASEAAHLYLLARGGWIGDGKWTPRALRRIDPALANRLSAALDAYLREDDKDALITFAEDVLAPLGGRLFAGYQQGGRQTTEPS